MRGSIVCGVDGSADSQAALRVAVGLADRLQLRLVVAHVAEPAYALSAAAAPFDGMVGRYVAMEAVRAHEEAAERLLEEVVAAAGLVEAEPRVGVGVPAERLADIADEEEAELVVVGSRGRGAFKAAFLGSVSTSLVGVARCPVLILPPGANETS
jgi:nucleotide-binding universal stress UspA family protein